MYARTVFGHTTNNNNGNHRHQNNTNGNGSNYRCYQHHNFPACTHSFYLNSLSRKFVLDRRFVELKQNFNSLADLFS